MVAVHSAAPDLAHMVAAQAAQAVVMEVLAAAMVALAAPMEVRLQAAMEEAMAVTDQRAEPGLGYKAAEQAATALTAAPVAGMAARRVARVVAEGTAVVRPAGQASPAVLAPAQTAGERVVTVVA